MDKKIKFLKTVVDLKLGGRIAYSRKQKSYFILIPIGYKGKEGIYKNKYFKTLEELEKEILGDK